MASDFESDAAACGLMQTADDGTFLRVNRTFCGWVGHDAASLIGRRRLQDLLTVGGRIFHQTHWAPLLRMQGSVSEVKLELVHLDGTRIPMVLNAVRRDHAGVAVHEVAAFVARDRDRFEKELVSARRRLEEAVEVTRQAQASALDRALLAEQLIGIVSHDLRNPLSTITMATALLGRGELSPAQRATIDRVKRATDRALHLIADLLDFTRARLGSTLPVDVHDLDLHAVVADALDDLRLAHPGRALVHVRRGEGRCDADANRVTQLLGNLVTNAAVYGDRAEAITVTSTIEAATVTLAVHNAGDPIPPDVLAVVFEPMTRGTEAHHQTGSVGLGLFIVREIAKAHGGRVGVRSLAGEGTTFEAIFPRERP